MNMRTTQPIERSIFRFLDILHKESRLISLSAIKRKWPGISDQDCKNLIKWWNINHNEDGDYDMIITEK